MELITIVIIYVSISFLLLKFPNLIHKPVPPNALPKKSLLIGAHRGGGGEHPENTLKAFTSSSWCDLLELDVVVTKDNQILISHDLNLERLCGQKVKISDIEFKDLPPYSTEFFSHFLEHKFSSQEPGRFCLLEDLFKQLPDKILCIDLKAPTDAGISEISRLIKKYNRGSLTVSFSQILGTNDSKLNKRIHGQGLGTMKFMTMGKIILIYLAYFFGFISLVGIDEDIMGIPLMTGTFKKLKVKEMGWLRAKA